MDRINPFGFYELGQTLKKLTSHQNDVSASLLVSEIFEASRLLTALIEEGKPIPIGLSRTPAKELMDYIDGIITTTYFRTDDDTKERRFRLPPTEEAIPAWKLNFIRSLLERFETVFTEEMREAASYFVPRRGIYWTPALVDSADETFPVDLVNVVPEKARTEWKAAGRCLAFNLLSASGFHVARAVESTLEAYYQVFSGKPGATLRSWHDYHKELEQIRAKGHTPAPQEKTLAELDQMRMDYRNPIMHPRVVLTEADAKMLFLNGESLIIAMAQELADAGQAGVQPSLALVASTQSP